MLPVVGETLERHAVEVVSQASRVVLKLIQVFIQRHVASLGQRSQRLQVLVHQKSIQLL